MISVEIRLTSTENSKEKIGQKNASGIPLEVRAREIYLTKSKLLPPALYFVALVK